MTLSRRSKLGISKSKEQLAFLMKKWSVRNSCYVGFRRCILDSTEYQSWSKEELLKEFGEL